VFVREMTIRFSWADTSTQNSRTGAALDGELSSRDTCAARAHVRTTCRVHTYTHAHAYIALKRTGAARALVQITFGRREYRRATSARGGKRRMDGDLMSRENGDKVPNYLMRRQDPMAA